MGRTVRSEALTEYISSNHYVSTTLITTISFSVSVISLFHYREDLSYHSISVIRAPSRIVNVTRGEVGFACLVGLILFPSEICLEPWPGACVQERERERDYISMRGREV